jgi:septal ring factor EnvC (AmiA/AmiB activator)
MIPPADVIDHCLLHVQQVLSLQHTNAATEQAQEELSAARSIVAELTKQVAQLEAAARALEKEKTDLARSLAEEKEEREQLEAQVGAAAGDACGEGVSSGRHDIPVPCVYAWSSHLAS